MGIMFFLIALELATLYSMVYLLSATRAYVGGEGLWSKAQKDAAIYLMKYANSRNEKDYDEFTTFIAVILGDKKARLALQLKHPNINVATQGLIEGRNKPADIPRMINLFIWFQHIYYLERAITLWTDADMNYIPKLIDLGNHLHQKIMSGNFTQADHDQIIMQIYQINSQLTQLEDNFSYALGEASRWLESVVLSTLLTIAIIVELSGLLLTVFVTFNIRKGIDEITRVSKKVMRLDFTSRAERYSNDEIGQLASSFNQMIDDLETSINNQDREINERILQTKRLETRYAITYMLAETFTLEKAIPNILKIMCEMMQFEYGGYWKVDSINQVLRCTNVWSLQTNKGSDEFIDACLQLTIHPGEFLPGKVYETKEADWINDISKEELHFKRLKLAQLAGLRSAISFPIIVRGETHGVFEFFTNYFYTVDHNVLLMFHDISNLISIFIERENAQKRAATLSRAAGMAEVASNVLHNVGNILNSINTSVILLEDKNTSSKLASLVDLAHLLDKHQTDLATFLETDKQGQNIPKFVTLLAQEWQQENKFFAKEINLLLKNVTHVKNIIMMQQSLSQIAGVTEEVSISELLENSIVINKLAYERTSIRIVRDYETIPPVTINKVKLFQILVNLVKNAIDSLLESKNAVKQLSIRLKSKDDDHFMIQISDTGIGILSENLTKIFSHGFTTKKTGHGFGLHTSALYAKEMGGDLIAESKGVELGATFTLILPYEHDAKGIKL